MTDLTGPLPAGLQHVQGRCPACGRAALFLGDGGYVTCRSLECPEPDAAEEPPDCSCGADVWCNRPTATRRHTGHTGATAAREGADASRGLSTGVRAADGHTAAPELGALYRQLADLADSWAESGQPFAADDLRAVLAQARPAPVSAEQLVRHAVITQARVHLYLSTDCLHGGDEGHAYCQGTTGKTETKKPAQCTSCSAPCICACHTDRAVPGHDTQPPDAEQQVRALPRAELHAAIRTLARHDHAWFHGVIRQMTRIDPTWRGRP